MSREAREASQRPLGANAESGPQIPFALANHGSIDCEDQRCIVRPFAALDQLSGYVAIRDVELKRFMTCACGRHIFETARRARRQAVERSCVGSCARYCKLSLWMKESGGAGRRAQHRP